MADPGYDLQYKGPPYNSLVSQQYPPPQSNLGYTAPIQTPPGAMQQGYAMNYGYGPTQGVYSQSPTQHPPPTGYNPQPIVNQPMGDNGGWMNMPHGQLNCPPGLEYLTLIDQLLIHQKVELLEVITGFETKNKFTIKNNLGQKVYYAKEDSDCCVRNCCGPMRPFDMKIFDNYQNEVIHLYRPLACMSCCYPCCLQSMEVYAPVGNLVGTVQQEWSILTPMFTIRNPLDEVVMRIKGPICPISCCSDVDFIIKAADSEEQVGKITKQWSGLLREMYTDADHFGISFPINLDVQMKAVMIGACFLIDAMYFERSGNK